MNITLVNTFEYKGGAAIACKRLQMALKAAGVSAELLVQDAQPKWEHTTTALTAWQATFSKLRLAVEIANHLRILQSSTNKFAFSSAIAGVDISRHPLIQHADIVHLHWINQGFLSLHTLQKLAAIQKPIVWTLHDMWAFTGGCHHSRTCNHYQQSCGNCWYLKHPATNDYSYRIWQQKKQLFQQLNLHVVTPSKWLQRCAQQSSLLQQVPIQVIPNPLNTDDFQPTTDKNFVRQQLHLPLNKFIIAMSAFKVTDARKGFQQLREAIHLLLAQRPELQSIIHLVLIGDIKEPQDLSLPISFSCTGYLQEQAQIISLYQAADIFVLPSLEENLPNTIMEALACGIPALAFNVGGIADLIHHQYNGYLAKYPSPDDLANGILWLHDTLQQSQNLVANARKTVEKKFTFQTIAQQYITLYHDIIPTLT